MHHYREQQEVIYYSLVVAELRLLRLELCECNQSCKVDVTDQDRLEASLCDDEGNEDKTNTLEKEQADALLLIAKY